MDVYESVSHTKWGCSCHVVFILKCRGKVLYIQLHRHLGEVLRKLAEHKECRIEGGGGAHGRPCAYRDHD